MTEYKLGIIRAAELYREKKFYSKPSNARIRNGLVEVRHQETWELEEHWDCICAAENPDFKCHLSV